VGGGSIFSSFSGTSHINDYDELIASFWKVLFGNAEDFELLLMLMQTKPTIELFLHLRATEPKTLVDKAYHGIFFNRTTFSGIQKASPIGGKNQNSEWTVDCRYNTAELTKRCREWRAFLKDRVTVSHLDFEAHINLHEGFVFADPPYVEVGNSLYTPAMTTDDHIRLRECLRGRDFLVTYDDHPLVRELYADCTIMTQDYLYTIHGAKTSNRTTQELIITKPLTLL